MARKKPLLVIFLTAFVLRLILLAKYHDQDITFGAPMALKHAAVARNLLKYGEFSINKEYLDALNKESHKEPGKPRIIDPQTIQDSPEEKAKPYMGRMPGYPILLASTWAVFGKK